MNCDDVRAQNLAERYVTGDLGDDERDAFEEHVFACPECLQELQVCQAIRAEVGAGVPDHGPMQETRKSWALPVALAASAAVIAVTLWSVLSEPGTEAERLRELAVFEPPAYAAGTLRSAGGEARQQYREAMTAYAAGDWATALAGLAAASEFDPEAPDITFFLGITHLLSGSDSDAIDMLSRTVALGETVYLEEARYYLAMAYLRAGNKAAAMRELELVAAMGGSLADETKALIQRIQAL